MVRRERLFLQVAKALKARILNGQIAPGDKLKSEPELAAEFNVSRSTVREALGYLETQGMLIRRHGVGSFVIRQQDAIVTGLERMESFTDTIRRSGHRAEDKVLHVVEVVLADDVALAMGLPPGSPGYEVKSLRTSDGVPVILTADFLSAALVQDIGVLQARKKYESLLEFLEVEMGIRADHALLHLSAVPASGEVATILEVAAGFPLVYLTGLVRDRSGRPIYYSRNFFRSDKYRFALIRRK